MALDQFVPNQLQSFWLELGWVIAFLILGILFAILRFWARWTAKEHKWGLDDLMMLPSLLMFMGLTLTFIVHTKLDILLCSDLGPEKRLKSYVYQQKAAYIGQIMGPLVVMFPKLSICFMFLRILTNKRTRLVVMVLMAFVIANGAIFCIIKALPCMPQSVFWKTVPFNPATNPQCLNLYALCVVSGVLHILSDAFLLVLPLPMILKLQVPPKKKLGLGAAILTGNIGMAACILRTISFAQVYFVNGAAVEDPSFDGIIRINMLTALEPTAYLIAACLPVIGGMFVRLDNTQHWRTYHDPVIRLRSLPNINAGSGAG